MTIDTVNPKLVPLALNEVDTATFEKFGQAFHAALMGKSFVPLGGMHDGGAEGYLEPELFGDQLAKHFIQVSKQKSYKTKILGTVKRLREFGRTPSSLTYITSEIISHIDVEEEDLSEKTECIIRIRDQKYIESQINSSDGSVSAFNTYLRPSIQYLFEAGAARISPRTAIYSDRTLAVFLRQEVDQRRGKSDLLESVADSLIIWSLSETDPEAGKFLGRDDVLAKIEAALPSARHFIRGVLDDRLERLRAKDNTQGRQVRYYPRQEKYCLPFETREIIAQENLEDSSLKISVSAVIERRCLAVATEDEVSFVPQVVEICHSVLERVFETQGLQVAQFVTNGEQDEDLFANVADIISAVVEENHSYKNDGGILRRLCAQTLRGTFYDATEEEKLYLSKLSKTYVLLLLLKNEPKIVEYFKSISSQFKLYVGTDLLVRAMSEHYLDDESQSTRNLFRILSAAGSTLILTQKTVEELATHIRAQILEFENVYMYVENKIPLEMVEYIDRILIRSYFYAKLAPLGPLKAPTGWRGYIDQFASYASIRSQRGDEDLARYLTTKFGMAYESTEEMTAGLQDSDVQNLAAEIVRVKSESGRQKDSVTVLAYNDALHVLRVYRRRRVDQESSPSNPFGFKTWWLTQDSKVRRAASHEVIKNGGSRFMMRPDFLLNFISLSPTAKEIESSYRTIFPSVLGIRLSNRVAEGTFKDVIKSANDIWSVDEARSASIITDLVNNLKGDVNKIYDNKW